MNKAWFKRKGLLMIPQTIAGWIILLLAIGYFIRAFFDIDKNSHSASDTLMNWAFRGLMVFIIYTAIAALSRLFTKES